MTCPYLAYRDESDDRCFDEPRAYCTAADRFVQPMRADICNDRYDLAHDRHCEIFLEHAGTDGDATDRRTENATDGSETGGDE
ncbi:hypothetical protein [Natronorubrum halophilum]|uniref:hypothetical protein n=1 Tax=Natronorubrum halophilum TaxID=1702106 RepID=UPI0010C15938|nr:hypothetical protein [Natronorubrum halophilum]